MNVEVRLFATLKERAGADSVRISLAEGATAAEAVAEVARCAGLGDLFDRLPVRLAVNRVYAAPEMQLFPQDELALIPPISGGSGTGGGSGLYALVSEEALSPETVTAKVSSPDAGAIVTFQGVTREVSRLDYESYAEMARQKMLTILGECVDRHGLEGAAAEHRVGSVPLGEPGVVVAVSAPHREQAFAGAREAIDRIKAEAPIWKREVDREGRSEWVEGTPVAAERTPARAQGDREAAGARAGLDRTGSSGRVSS
ncbi:MAG: molybdenum cofactor biosynthesis protein MoaE [Solirubrobacterales bacterium]|nr:molybdenum cofactor biosynthesis protein MoaE [Solirubrobacterales bacterium]